MYMPVSILIEVYDSVSQKCLIKLKSKEMGCWTVFMFYFIVAYVDNPNEKCEFLDIHNKVTNKKLWFF